MAVELKKINFIDFQEPSIGAENLNQMQENTQTALNDLDMNKQDTLIAGENITIENGIISATGGGNTVEEIVLYENSTGITTGSFELNDTIVNYKKIDIYYARSTGAFNKSIQTVEISNTAGVNWFIPLTLMDDDGSTKYINSARLGVKDKTVTINGNTYNVKIGSTGNVSVSDSPLLAIFKIVGYKK